MAGGASVTVLTKSGTNELPRHRHLAARGRQPAGAQLGQLGREARHQAQHRRRHAGRAHPQGQAVLLRRPGRASTRPHRTRGPAPLPTAAMRAGDFSAFGTTIYDPATGNADGTGRTPFPNNIIPANRISSISQSLQSRLPAAQRAGHVQQLHRHRAGGLHPQQLRRQAQLQRQLRGAGLREVQPDERRRCTPTCGWATLPTAARAATASATARARATPRCRSAPSASPGRSRRS